MRLDAELIKTEVIIVFELGQSLLFGNPIS
jgi:hypothetical protein